VKRAALLTLLLLMGCDSDATHVAGPFYLMWVDISEETALYRCPDGPDRGIGCAIDGLPGSTVFAAGADRRYVVVARHPRDNNATNKDITQYFYFARIPEESKGWGNNPEKIIGPLTQRQFDAHRISLHLPDLSIVLDDLK
jgi:hypothetical protein